MGKEEGWGMGIGWPAPAVFYVLSGQFWGWGGLVNAWPWDAEMLQPESHPVHALSLVER